MPNVINVRHFTIQFILLILFLGSLKVSAQLSVIHDYKRSDSVAVVTENADTLLFPFAGGLNSCQFANIDIDLDGIEDLLVFDRHGNRIMPFLVQSNTPSKFRYSPELADLFPPIVQWMQTIDYNTDGRKDIFTYTTGGIKVYRNDSENNLTFTEVTHPFLLSLQGTTLTNILVTSADYPAIADVDADGDMDVLTFWGLGSFVEWHKNLSVEKYGNTDSLDFQKASSCWGHFAEGNEDNTIILDTCPSSDNLKLLSRNIEDDPKHTGSTMLLHDLNGDGLPDLTIGDVDFSTLIHLTNGGSLAEAHITSQTTDFPDADDPVNMNAFPAAMLADVNNDGKKDLLVSPFDPSLTKSKNFRSVSLYLEMGTPSQPDYTLVSESFLQDQMLDLGSGAYPVFFDSNSDGLMDLLVGNYGYSDTCVYSPTAGLQCTFKSSVALLLNTGTQTKPAFQVFDRNIAMLDTLNMQSLIPSLADMDSDGDSDLVCGNSIGQLIYCENTALPGQPADFKLIDTKWQSIDVGDFAAPQLLDINKDGLVDIVCGKRNGTLSFYKNTGIPQEADFILVTDKFGGVDVTDPQLSNYGFSVPCLYTDKQGEILLFAGSEYGDIFVYDQINNNLDGSFRLLGTLPGIKEGWRSGVAVGNLNNDTLTDMLVGNYSGGMGLFYGKPDKIFGIGEQMKNKFSALRITPNPASNLVSVEISSDLDFKSEYLVIQGIQGNSIREFTQVDFPMLLDVSGLKNGIYLVSVLTNLGVASGKLVICR